MSKTEAIDEIKKNLKTDKLVYGTERTLKLLKASALGRVFLSANVPEDVEKDFRYYCDLVKVPVEKLSLDNEKLGIFCKKQYFISVIGLLK